MRLSRLSFTLALGALALPVAGLAAEKTRTIDGPTGPAHPKGLSVEERGALALGREFAESPVVSTRALRTRVLTLEPGGVVLIHDHTDRPAVTLIQQGEVIEHRSDSDEPILRRAGDVTFEGDGIAQWWENKGEETVIFYVVDFFDTGTKPGH